MIRLVNTDTSNDILKKELIERNIEVGMVEFVLNEDILPISDKFEKIGNFELDILAIDQSCGTIVLLDHDKPDFIMGKAAINLKCMINALKPIEEFFEASSKDDSLYDNEKAMIMVTAKST